MSVRVTHAKMVEHALMVWTDTCADVPQEGLANIAKEVSMKH